MHTPGLWFRSTRRQAASRLLNLRLATLALTAVALSLTPWTATADDPLGRDAVPLEKVVIFT